MQLDYSRSSRASRDATHRLAWPYVAIRNPRPVLAYHVLLYSESMNVAIPVWQGRVSPVFDVAGQLLVVELHGSAESVRRHGSLTGRGSGPPCPAITGLGGRDADLRCHFASAGGLVGRRWDRGHPADLRRCGRGSGSIPLGRITGRPICDARLLRPAAATPSWAMPSRQ